MHRFVSGWALLLLAGACGLADPTGKATPAGKVVRDQWEAAYLDGNRAGYIHTIVREIEKDGQKLYETTVTLDLTLRRFQETIRQQMETGTVETADGKVASVMMTQTLGREQQLKLTGTVALLPLAVDPLKLHVKVSGAMNMDKMIRWDDQVVGLYRELQLFKEKKAKPGDHFSYLHYEPLINAVVKVQVDVKEPEEVEVTGLKQKLLRAEALPDKIVGVQLPATAFWLDKDLQVVRSQMSMPGLGKLVMVRATKELAQSPVKLDKVTDIGVTQLIAVNKRIANPQGSGAVVYRITLPNDDEPGKAFPQDGRQQVKNAKGKAFELHVKAVRKPEAMKEPPAAAEEFLKSNYFINCDDDKVKKLAKQAVGNEKDPWGKAVKIEKWVHDHMKIQNFSEAMATADHVARTLEGDCTEYAMLAAAMCRAAGVPSRTALGLIYVDMAKGPVFAYHMWTEVYVQGQWLSLDATLGKGSIGAAHLKITDHSWFDQRSLAPLLPVMRVMLGKPAIEVVRIEGSE